eukprot:jgi/Tetstr1/426757/TSEL_001694.t1
MATNADLNNAEAARVEAEVRAQVLQDGSAFRGVHAGAKERLHDNTSPSDAKGSNLVVIDVSDTKGGKKPFDTSWEKCLTLPWKLVEAVPLSYAKAIHDASGSREVFNEDGTMVRKKCLSWTSSPHPEHNPRLPFVPGGHLCWLDIPEAFDRVREVQACKAKKTEIREIHAGTSRVDADKLCKQWFPDITDKLAEHVSQLCHEEMGSSGNYGVVACHEAAAVPDDEDMEGEVTLHPVAEVLDIPVDQQRHARQLYGKMWGRSRTVTSLTCVDYGYVEQDEAEELLACLVRIEDGIRKRKPLEAAAPADRALMAKIQAVANVQDYNRPDNKAKGQRKCSNYDYGAAGGSRSGDIAAAPGVFSLAAVSYDCYAACLGRAASLSTGSYLVVDDRSAPVRSEDGVQQGAPLATTSFCVAIHPEASVGLEVRFDKMQAYMAGMEAARREAPADIEWLELDGHHGIAVLNVPLGSPEYVQTYMRGKAEELHEEVDASLSNLLSAKPSRRYTHAMHNHAWTLLKHCMQHRAGYWLRNCLPSEVEAFAEAVDATILAAVKRVLGVSVDPSTYGTDTNPVVTDFLAELLHDPDPMAAEVATLSEDAVAMARSRLHLPTRLKGAGIRRMATVRDAAFIGSMNDILPRERILFNQLDAASGMWTVAIPTARTVMTPHELREVAVGYFFLPSLCLAPVAGSQIILPSTEHNLVTVDLYGDALMNLPAPRDAHWRVQHDAIAVAFRYHGVHDLARDAAWHNTEPGQKGPLRDILDMSEYTGMVFGTVGEDSIRFIEGDNSCVSYVCELFTGLMKDLHQWVCSALDPYSVKNLKQSANTTFLRRWKGEDRLVALFHPIHELDATMLEFNEYIAGVGISTEAK